MSDDEFFLFDDVETDHDAPQLVGQVMAIRFAAQDSFYKVLQVKITEQNIDYEEEEIVVTGSFGDIQIGAGYEFTGKLTKHPRFGDQFAANNYVRQATSSSSGLVSYLSSEQFAGVGKATATKIVDALGVQAIDRIISDESVLDEVNLSDKVRTSLVEQLKKSDGMDRVIIALNDFGFGANLATLIYQKYQLQTLTILKENPYQLVLEIDGVSFNRIDQLAQQQGMDALDARRIQAGVIVAMNEATFNAGDTFMQADSLQKVTRSLLERNQNVAVDERLIKRAILTLISDGLLVADGDRLYMTQFYQAEIDIAEKMVQLSRAKQTKYSREEVVAALEFVEKVNLFPYDADQRDAIIAALTSNLFILTGGPGTGKTTIVNGIVKSYQRLLQNEGLKSDEVDESILLAAPTGRAAKRLSEATERDASTIHRMLGITGRETTRDLDLDLLTGRLLVIDEMSMVDTELFALLLGCVPLGMQVVLVGDRDQLPSVGPGRVFYDLLATGMLNFRELETIHRQGKGSTIIELAAAVKHGQLPDNFTEQQIDRSFFPAQLKDVPNVVQKVARSWHERGNSVADMQILAPMYKSDAGVHNLNRIAQDIFNPMTGKKREIKLRMGDISFAFRVGDKVMQTVNDPENNVFNGDIGYITSILFAKDEVNDEKTDVISVAFDSGEVTYVRQDFNQITLAYATTIHKAQGSEYKLVILPMVSYFRHMLQRNLLYTGLTRASESLVLLGELAAFRQATMSEGINRQTTLPLRIQQVQAGETIQLPEAPSVEAVAEKAQEVTTETTNVVDEQPAAEEADTALESVEQAPEVEEVEQEVTISKTKDYHLTPELVASGEINPNIGMAGITPYEFMAEK